MTKLSDSDSAGTMGEDGNNDVTAATTTTTMVVTTTEHEEMSVGEARYWGSYFREVRHNHCMMKPISLLMFFLFGIFLLVTLVLQLPGLVMGLILAPIIQRSAWYVEFLYPLPIGRWAHLLLMEASSKVRLGKSDDKNRGLHSRTIEQKIEVVPGRVYIHPIPQWVDNLGYLVVCLPQPTIERTERSIITVEEGRDPIVGFIIDSGQCDAVVKTIELIQEYHYNKRSIRLESIVSTHKHHDHTGGNTELLKHAMGSTITRVYGGAVEKVPNCTDHLVNGEKLTLPKFGSNDMNLVVEVEAIAVPAHTRGSMVYRLRTKTDEVGQAAVEFLFTGDTIFSGGSGVPFEADVGSETESQLAKSNGNTFIRGNLGPNAMERCFAEVMARAMPNDHSSDATERILIFPGHEYTQELLARQFQNAVGETSKWKNFPPRDYFETVSQLYIAFHRRSLPHNSGRLLMVPSTLQREIHINTVYRSMRQTGELVSRAIVYWYDHFCKTKGDTGLLQDGSRRTIPTSNGTRQKQQHRSSNPTPRQKTPSAIKKWNLDVSDINRSVFTTVYTADLESVFDDLVAGRLSKKRALDQLQTMKKRMDQPVVNKRAIPGFLPSDKHIYRGICGLAILGSKPKAMTLSDSRTMHLPPPNDYNSDKTLVSMNRLILVLTRLGLIHTSEGEDISVMIRLLWNEANEYSYPKEYRNSEQKKDSYDGVDVESPGHWHDEVEIGMLKWLMYGVTENQPSWFSKIFCMPCSSIPPNNFVYPEHPASSMNKRSGDLVSHDVLTCYLCRSATGNVQLPPSSRQCTDVASRRMATKTSSRETVSEGSDVEGDHDIEQLASSLRQQISKNVISA